MDDAFLGVVQDHGAMRPQRSVLGRSLGGGLIRPRRGLLLFGGLFGGLGLGLLPGLGVCLTHLWDGEGGDDADDADDDDHFDEGECLGAMVGVVSFHAWVRVPPSSQL